MNGKPNLLPFLSSAPRGETESFSSSQVKKMVGKARKAGKFLRFFKKKKNGYFLIFPTFLCVFLKKNIRIKILFFVKHRFGEPGALSKTQGFLQQDFRKQMYDQLLLICKSFSNMGAR